eukprot:94471_1
MKSIIASLFAIYSLSSSSRLLLQIPVVLPPQSNGGPPPDLFECVEPYLIEDQITQKMVVNPLNKCAGEVLTFQDPVNMFEFTSGAFMATASAELHFNYGAGSVTEHLNLIEFSEEYSGYMTKVFINNQGPNNVQINKISCGVETACNDMEVWLTNADLGDFDCIRPSYCSNCRVYEVGQVDPATNAPLFKPCHGW